MPRTSLWYLTGILSIVFFQASFDEFKLFLVLILMPSDMQSNLHIGKKLNPNGKCFIQRKRTREINYEESSIVS